MSIISFIKEAGEKLFGPFCARPDLTTSRPLDRPARMWRPSN
jgi:hypothetical protein